MVSVKRIVDAYLRHNGMRIIAGERGCGDVLYPFLLMDLQYSIYQSEIRDLKCRHKMKAAKSRWRDAYGVFTRSFFAALDEDERDEMIGLMDGYGEWMESVLMNARVAVMNEISEREFGEQKLLSACLLCNCLAQCANIVWRTVFLNGRGRGVENKAIEDVARASKLFADAYMEERGDLSVINLNGRPKVDAAMNALVRRLSHYPPLCVARELQEGEDSGE